MRMVSVPVFHLMSDETSDLFIHRVLDPVPNIDWD